MGTEDTTADLPPRPDPETGEPRPPAAPAQVAEGHNERKPKRVPAPPKGHGPVLEYYRERGYLSWLGGFVPVVVLLIAFTAYGGFVVLTYWPLWLIVGLVYTWTVYVGRANVVTAGADWVMCRKHWVRTYELTRIRYVSRGVSGAALNLSDRERSFEIPLSAVQANRKLWDYVYLGMRHSAAKGAEVNRAARNTCPELGGASHGASSEEE